MTAPTTDNDSEQVQNIDLSKTRKEKKDHDSIVAWAKKQYEQMRSDRSITERQWYINLAFYFGRQNVAPVRSGNYSGGKGNTTTRLYVPPAPYYRARPVINRIRPTIRTELSMLTGNKPTATVVPASAEDRDTYAANAAEQIWIAEYTNKDLKAKIRRAMWWTCVTGCGYMKTWWDASAGETDRKTGLPQGDIKYTHETPFHVLAPDLREEELENQPFIMHAQMKSKEWVKANYRTAIDGTGVDVKSVAGNNEILDSSFLDLMGATYQNQRNEVLVLEAWVKPGAHERFPDGAMFTIIGDKIVQGYEGWPYSHEMFPFAKFDHIPTGKFYYASSIEDLVPLQKEYNRTRGQIIEAKNRMAKPQMAAQRGAVDASKITSEPGLLIEYTPGFEAPTPVPLQDLPSYVIQEQDRLVNDWQDIAGIHEVSQGEVPPGVTAATAISYLQERDESKLTPTFDSLEEGLQKIARMGLTYVKDYWTTERTVKTTGEQSYFDVLTFKGSDLRGNTDIRIESGSSLPVSKSAKQALIMDLMKMGFIPPEKGLQVMDMGGISKLYEQVQIDRKQVQRENMKMSKVTMKMMDEYQQQNEELLAADPYHFGVSQDPQTGQQIPKRPPAIVPVNTWDNHKLHIQYHNDYRKTQDFENLPQFVKDLFEEHVMQHVMALGAEQQTMNPAFAAGTEQPGAGQPGTGQPGMENPEEEPEQGSAKEPGQPPVGNAKQSGEQGPDPIPKTQDEVQE